MDSDFVPDFSLVHRTGEIFNEKSQIQSYDDYLLISHDNLLLFFDVQTEKVVNKIGIEKKKIISSYCEIDGNFVIGYDDGSLYQFNNKNEKNFGCRLSKKKITGLFVQNNLLYVGTVNGYVFVYDLLKNTVVYTFEREKSSLYGLRHNDKVFVNIAKNTFCIFEFEKKAPVKIEEIESKIVDFGICEDVLVLLDENGKFYFYNLDKFEFFDNNLTIKSVKSLYFTENQFFAISPNKKVYEFSVKKEFSTLKITENNVTDCSVMKMAGSNGDIFVFSTNNQIYKISSGEKRSILQFHSTEIKDLKIIDSFVFTLSDEKIIKWGLPEYEESDKYELEYINSYVFEYKTSCLTEFNGNICIFDSEGIKMISKIDFSSIQEKKIENINFICAQGELLAVGSGTKVTIFDKNFKKMSEIFDESDISFLKFSNNMKLLGIANLSNKINIYDVSAGHQLMSLYGHALPVRSFDFCPDDKSLISCSADKLVKIWGVEFGECRKTLQENTSKVIYMKHNKDLFFIANENIKFFKKNDKIKEFKNFRIKSFEFNDNFLIAVGKFGIDLYRMNKYELLEDSSSEFDEDLEIEDQKKHDRFEKALEKSFEENDFTDLLYEFENIDLAEINSLIKLLDKSSLIQILKMLQKHSEMPTIPTIRIFLSIIQHHKAFCQENEMVHSIYFSLFARVKGLHKLIKENTKETSKI